MFHLLEAMMVCELNVDAVMTIAIGRMIGGLSDLTRA